MPLTQQVLPEDLSELTGAISDLKHGRFSWLILTSGNTVRALVSCGWDGSVPEDTRVGVVGPGTARVLEELTGLPEAWMPRQHSATGILAELPAPGPGENPRLLLPQSAQARGQLVAGLRSLGWEPTQVLAYQTVALNLEEQSVSPSRSLQQRQFQPPAAVDDDAVLTPAELNDDDVVLVTSSTAAEQWASRRPRTQVWLLAIGGPTAETLKRLGTPADRVLSAPTAAGVLACVS